MKIEDGMIRVKSVQAWVRKNGEQLKYNRSVGAYQIIGAFRSSIPFYEARDEKGVHWLSMRDVGAIKAIVTSGRKK